MIHTKELMLGNYVTYLDTPMYVTGIFSDTAYLNFEGNEGDVFEIEEESLAGVPITEELLEKCGFRKGEYYWFGPDETEVALVGSVALMDFMGDGDWRVTDIQFLHELQNAYYMLTKKQLEVKL